MKGQIFASTIFKSLILLSLILLVACDNRRQNGEETNSQSSRHNILKDYVRKPLDQAKDVKKEADQRTRDIDKALDE